MDKRLIFPALIGLVVYKLLYIRRSNQISAKAALSPQLKLDIRTVSQQYSVPANLIAAVIMVESSGNPLATGAAGERGLMQMSKIALADVNANYHTTLTFEQMYAPNANLLAGSLYLKLQLQRFSLAANAVRAYNQGESGAKKLKGWEYLFKVQRYA